MVTCTGSSLAYGVGKTQPYVNTLLQGVPLPRTNQLPPASSTGITCGPE